MRPNVHCLAPRLIACAFALAIAGLATRASAAPTDAEVDARLGFIEARLDAGTAAANRWSYGWLTTFGTLSVAQFGVALGTTDRGLRIDTAVGAVSSAFGTLSFALVPFVPRFAASELRAYPARTPDERRRKLARAEALLQKSAKVEAFGRTWVPHVVGSGVAIAWGFVLALGYHRIRTGIINGAIGAGIVEIQIWTQPTAAIDDWKAYSSWPPRNAHKPQPASLSIAPGDGGVMLLGRF